jgi:hypothetical protein
LHPSFGVTLEEIKKRLAGKLKVSSKSTLCLAGECTLKNISVDGKLCIMANGLVENVVVEDKKYGEFVPADMQNPNLAPYLKIRAFDHL